MAGLMLLAVPLLQTFFESGAFTANDAMLSGWAMMAYAAGLPAYITTKVTMSAFYANEDTITPVKIAVATLIVNVVASLLLMQHFAHVGIAAGTAIAGYFNAALQLFVVQRQGFIQLDLKTLAWPLVKGFGLGMLLLGILMAYKVLVPFGEGFLWRFSWMLGALVIGLGLFTAGAELLKLFAVRQVIRKFI